MAPRIGIEVLHHVLTHQFLKVRPQRIARRPNRHAGANIAVHNPVTPPITNSLPTMTSETFRGEFISKIGTSGAAKAPKNKTPRHGFLVKGR
ncbi:MAG: hypothetical protein ABSC76_04435 [Terracidiphilus sp.]|jgi:hypothetical protein